MVGPNGGNLDPRIDAGGAALGGATEIDDDINSFFNLVTYRGAFGNRVNWLEQLDGTVRQRLPG
jgi:hypothetical protein